MHIVGPYYYCIYPRVLLLLNFVIASIRKSAPYYRRSSLSRYGSALSYPHNPSFVWRWAKLHNPINPATGLY
jgi:hypothetical protein